MKRQFIGLLVPITLFAGYEMADSILNRLGFG
jgi:hypothetical protein